jgi:fatty-acyl-CoA synthase
MSSFDLLVVAKRQQDLQARHPEWVPRRLDQLLDAVVEEFPDRQYVLIDRRYCTNRDVQEWSVRIAAGLARLGVKVGDHVAVVLANYPEFSAVKYGIARVGATCVPVSCA